MIVESIPPENRIPIFLFGTRFSIAFVNNFFNSAFIFFLSFNSGVILKKGLSLKVSLLVFMFCCNWRFYTLSFINSLVKT